MRTAIVFGKRHLHGDAGLLCFPYAGAGPSLFNDWLMVLGASIDIGVLQAPGKGARVLEPPHSRIEQLVGEITDAIIGWMSHQRRRVFFGHSFGGLLAYEVASELECRGMAGPSLLIVSASEPAHRINQRCPRESYSTLTDEQLIAHLREHSATPLPVLEHRDAMRVFLPGIRADYTVLEHYRWQPRLPLTAPIKAFCGREDRLDAAELSRWAELTSGGFDIETLPGDHFFINQHAARVMRRVWELVMGDGTIAPEQHL